MIKSNKSLFLCYVDALQVKIMSLDGPLINEAKYLIEKYFFYRTSSHMFLLLNWQLSGHYPWEYSPSPTPLSIETNRYRKRIEIFFNQQIFSPDVYIYEIK